MTHILDCNILKKSQIIMNHLPIKKKKCTYEEKNPASCQTSLSASAEVFQISSKHANTHCHCLINAVILPLYDQTAYQWQSHDTRQVKLDRSPWFSSRKLSQRHSQAAQADVVLVSKMRQTLFFLSVQLSEREVEMQQCWISCLTQDTGQNSCIRCFL